ncbi:nucleotide exchange factor GrpE [Candidatus Micrarchaeota archaeon]|nr:nucleotide exchange factor GrpE [Candidatus Micrarchaeota archaeon]
MTDEKELPAPEEKELLETPEELKLLTETQEQRIADLENLVKRLQADFENFRKQNEKEKNVMRVMASASVIKKLLSSLDEIQHSVEEAKKHNEANDIVNGFEMAYKNLIKVLEQEGLREMESEGEIFDPHKHEAIKYEENDLEDGKIIQTVRKGYYFHEIVLRPAVVVVSKGPKKVNNSMN